MRRMFTAVALAALTAFSVDLGYSQTMHRSMELTGFGGIRVYDKDVVFMDSGFVAGGKLAWFPHPNIGVEGTISFSSADVTFEEAPSSIDTDGLEGESVDVTEIRFDAVYQFLYDGDQRVVPYFSAGVGQFVFDSDVAGLDEPELTVNYGGGLKFFINERIAIRVDARDNVADIETGVGDGAIPSLETKTFQANNPEFTAGITIGIGGDDEGFGRKDTDFDGVVDKDDLCPNTQRGVIVDATGCPIDSDSDGVPDGLDACPNTPEGATVDNRGCPIDSDGDGVYDGLDRCPNTAAGVQVDESGCPIEVEEPEPETCLGSQDWYTGDATISFDGRSWVKFGSTQTASMDILTQVGEYQGVPIYVGSNARRPYREVWLPVCDAEDTYQPYRRVSEVRGTTGFIQDAN